MPAPDHAIHNILRMTGSIPSQPNEAEARMQALMSKNLDQRGPKLVHASSVLSTSPLQLLIQQLHKFFSSGLTDAAVKFAALRLAPLEGKTAFLWRDSGIRISTLA